MAMYQHAYSSASDSPLAHEVSVITATLDAYNTHPEARNMGQIELFMIYRMLIVLGGILCIYLGYRLFYIVQERQGDFKVKYGEDLHIQIRDVAPGTYFALLGTLILGTSLMYKTEVKTEISSTYAAQDPSPPANPIQVDTKGMTIFEYDARWRSLYKLLPPPHPTKTTTTIHTVGWMECKSIVQKGCYDFKMYQK